MNQPSPEGDATTRRLHACIDETERNNPPGESWYLMCAVTIDVRCDSNKEAMNRLDGIAQRQPADRLNRRGLHANQMARTGTGTRDLFDAEQIIANDTSLHIDIAVKPVRQGQTFEHTRQTCLTQLLTHLDNNVTTIMLDTRDPLDGKTRKPRPGTDPATGRPLVNHHDQHTIIQLQASTRLKKDVDVIWADDTRYHHLWLPDVIAYACGQALANNNPARLARLADQLNIQDTQAKTQPPGTGIADKLEHLRQQATHQTAPRPCD